MIGKGMEELIFKQLVADFNVNDKINWVNDGEKLLESVSLVIQTSYLNESVAYIKKAIQHKIPVLSLISNETLEFIHPHQNGWFFEPDDEERVVKILDKFLKNPSILDYNIEKDVNTEELAIELETILFDIMKCC